MNRIKDGARLLARASDLQRSKSLECMAEALRFPNWYALHSHLEQANLQSDPVSEAWVERLRYSIILLAHPDSDVALPPAQIVAFEDLATRISAGASIPVDVALDKVCAGMCSASSWAEVKNRSPLRATAPLYSFELVGSRSGRFVESAACQHLIKELDRLYQGPSSPERLSRARRWIEETLIQQPGFLEAGLCLAQIQYDTEGDNRRQSLDTINHYIKQAEALIPKGYRGDVSWGWISNRFYHRMLWLRMTIYHDAEWMRECLRGARKQLRLNPGDNLGVRDYYPLMLLEAGEYEKAMKAARYPKEGGFHQALVRAFCFFANDKQAAFFQELTTALFSVPILRLFLMDDFDGTLPDGDEGFRGVIPDMKTFTKFAWPAYTAVPGLSQACVEFLSDPLVVKAESELRTYWLEFWQRGAEAKGNYEGWQVLVKKLDVEIQQHFATN